MWKLLRRNVWQHISIHYINIWPVINRFCICRKLVHSVVLWHHLVNHCGWHGLVSPTKKMAYFNDGSNRLTFTKSLKGIRDHALKFVIVLLLTTLVLFSTVSSLRPWFLVNVECSLATSSNTTKETDVIKEQLIFGLSTICVKNATTFTETCKQIASFDIAGAVRKSLNVQSF